ncbi:hypothetical protein BCD67_11250 [Oscillatoriales cyanobacterium USR001]|nr:hypothetical protein BCD67_11250 [Oscillatoriales cyanobacterium USR001]
MTIRELTIAKLQQLSEPLLQEVSDYMDFLIQKHLAKTANIQTDEKLVEAWSQWFDEVDLKETNTAEPASEYQHLLLNKYRQQGLTL